MLEGEWRKEEEKSRTSKDYKPSLFRALLRCFGKRYALLGIFTAFEECVLRIYQPLFMGDLLLLDMLLFLFLPIPLVLVLPHPRLDDRILEPWKRDEPAGGLPACHRCIILLLSLLQVLLPILLLLPLLHLLLLLLQVWCSAPPCTRSPTTLTSSESCT